MLRPAGIVADSVVVPVVKNNVAGARSVCVIFYPCAELLEKLDHLAAAALGRDNVSKSRFNSHS